MKMKGTLVSYFGLSLWITMPFVAVDMSGHIYEYEDEPLKYGYHWDTSGDARAIGEVYLEGIDLTTTKREFDLK